MNRPVSPLSDGQLDGVASLVLALMPTHKVWCEPWFHDGEVFFRKPRSPKEVINDNRGGVMAFYLMVRQRWQQLAFLMEGTFAADFWRSLADKLLADGQADTLYRAWAYWVRCNAGQVSPDRWSVSDVLDIPDSNEDRAREQMLRFMSDRLRQVLISDRDPLEVIRGADGPDTLFYVCPPDRAALESHIPVLAGLRGKVILRLPDTASASRIGCLQWHADEAGRKAGLYTNFRRERSLFD